MSREERIKDTLISIGLMPREISTEERARIAAEEAAEEAADKELERLAIHGSADDFVDYVEDSLLSGSDIADLLRRREAARAEASRTEPERKLP